MHRIIQCRVRLGLQAIIENKLSHRVIAVLTDGFVVDMDDWQVATILARYEELASRRSNVWGKKTWDKHGYNLVWMEHGPSGMLFPIKRASTSETKHS